MLKRAVLTFLMLFSFSFLTLRGASSFFVSTAVSSNNTFSTAEEFPSVTPTATISPTPEEEIPAGQNPGDVVINEIMWMGSSLSTADEWIELRNMTSEAINIGGWTIDGLGSGIPGVITIEVGKTIPPNGYYIIANDPQSDSILAIDPDQFTASVSINNESEILVLKNGSLIIDNAGLGTGSWFAGINSTVKSSMERTDSPSDGTVSTNWETANTKLNLDDGVVDFATPGGEN